MQDTEHLVAVGLIFHDDSQGHQIIYVLDTFNPAKLLMQAVRALDPAVNRGLDASLAQLCCHLAPHLFQSCMRAADAFLNKLREFTVPFGLQVLKGELLDFNFYSTHSKPVCQRCEYLYRLFCDFLLPFWRKV